MSNRYSQLLDLSGERYTRLTVIREETRNGRKRRWECQCDCGKVLVVEMSNLRNGHTRSSGCYEAERRIEANTRHGLSQSSTYHIWYGMLERCRNPRHHAYKDYGGRGITVCDRWQQFENFV